MSMSTIGVIGAGIMGSGIAQVAVHRCISSTVMAVAIHDSLNRIRSRRAPPGGRS